MNTNKIVVIKLESPKMKFSAGHFTIFSNNSRENLHGHNFKVKCYIETSIEKNGMAFDYNIFKNKLIAICNQLDEIILLPKKSPHIRLEESDIYYFCYFSIEVNLIAPAILNRLLIPKMLKGSSIIYIGSTLSEKAVKNAASYVITKHALLGMMKATTQDLAGKNIHTICICPGFTDTKMLKTHIQENQQKIDHIFSKVCFNKLIEPEEIAKLIFYCANNPLLNGATIHANYGQIGY